MMRSLKIRSRLCSTCRQCTALQILNKAKHWEGFLQGRLLQQFQQTTCRFRPPLDDMIQQVCHLLTRAPARFHLLVAVKRQQTARICVLQDEVSISTQNFYQLDLVTSE